MRIVKMIPVAGLAVALAGPAAAEVSAVKDKAAGKLAFTTKSEEARAHALETVRRIESLQPGPQIQEAAKKAVEADPGFALGHYLVGVTTFPPPQAKPHLDKAVELAKNASDGERRYIEAAMLNRAQKPKEALEAFRKLREDYPTERMVHMMIGQISAGQGQIEEARAAYERAVELDASTPRVHALLANVYMLKGDYTRARTLYETALARKAPGTAPGQAHFGIAMSHLYEGRPDAALKVMQAYLEEYRKTPAVQNQPEVFIWNAIGRINLEHGRLDEALKAYEKGFESVPGSSLSENNKKLWRGRLHHGRGRTLARMGRHEDAWQEAETVKQMIGEAGEEGKQFLQTYHYLAGYVKLEACDHAAAIEHLKQADPSDPFNKLLLARAYEKAGDKESARKAYGEVLASTQNSLDRALAYPEAKRKLAVM